MNPKKPLKDNAKDTIFFIALVIAVWAIYLLGKNIEIKEVVATWRWILFIMIAFIIVLSILITDEPLFGWLINEQNRMSLSRLQMFLWTSVILSAFTTAVFVNLKYSHIQTAIDIQIPEALWLAMGISTTSLVGTGLILESKKDKHPKKVELKKVEDRNGLLNTKENPSLLDLVRGEEITNSDKIDLTRLQNLFFTFVLVGVYMANLSAMFTNLASAEIGEFTTKLPVSQFPDFGESALALLIISHAGYLAAKAVDKEPAEEGEAPTRSAPANPVG